MVESAPPGAEVEVDGRRRGPAPARLAVPAGERRVTVQRPGYIPATYPVAATTGATTRLTAALWTASPRVERVRPPYPGTQIRAAAFLGDGSLALAVAVPPGESRQLWLREAGGALRRVGSEEASGGLAVSPDGARIASLARGPAPGGGPGAPGAAGATELWVAGAGGGPGARRHALATGDEERLVDLGWTPDGRALLVVGRRSAGGGATTRLRRVGAESGEVRELVSLPAELVPGAYAWSPSGDRVVLLARTDRGAALCVLGLADGAFCYLADLEPGAPPPFAPAGWSPDGRRLRYTAPLPSRPAVGLLPLARRPEAGLFELEPAAARPEPRLLGEGVGRYPAWRPDGGAVALATARGGQLVLRALEPAGGSPREVARLPLRTAGAFAASWDVVHGQVLVTVAAGSLDAGRPEHWLVQFTEAIG